ncbi:glycosyltransferase family 4 protein [Arcobacter roscoffensis]|uniref:Glycosyltransferase family 4 protein n=1 Tax=Arcobacter roscoffensis TaxID=2961520 RepID=A0ABY5E0R7_9BACT|nr:glycosyltransferase family 4 protein [Arcobacter roscoffensis]UTJ05791.1 glycosyltransferase family 4 protein [Arcobacter roscoffensis]
MKLLYITNGINGSGGLERVLSIKASYFTDVFNYEVNILTLNDGNKNIFFDFSRNIKFHDIKINKSNPFTFISSYKNGIQNVIENILPDIIIVCDDGLKGMLFPIIFGKKIPTIYERHAAKELNINSKLLFFLIRPILNMFDKFVLLTNGNKLDWKGVNSQVINNPIPLENYNPDYIFEKKEKIVLAVGSNSFHKGFDLLINSWKIVHEKYPEWNLKIFGKKNPRLGLESLIDLYNLSSSIQLNNPEKNISEKYKSASIYALSSRHEGFGMVLVEAMSFGVACVSFDCPHGPKDIISNGEDGFIVENGNINKFADKLIYLIENENKRLEFGHKALENVKRFDIENIALEWERLFNQLVKNK